MTSYGKGLLMLGLLVLMAGCQFLPAPSSPSPTRPAPTATLPPTSTMPPPSPTPKPTSTPTLQPTPTAVPMALKGLRLSPLGAGPITLVALRMVDEQQGWAIGTRNETVYYLLRTQDGGRTWTDVSPPLAGDRGQRPALAVWDGDRAWVAYPVEDLTQASPVVWRTQDGGRTWEAAPIAMKEDEFRFAPGPLVATDASRLWLLVHLEGGMHHDYAALFASQDGGVTWHRVTDPWNEGAADLMSLYTTDLAFTPDGYGWATKSNGVAPGGVLVVTEDGGVTWRAETLVPPGVKDVLQAPTCDTASPHLWARDVGTVLLTCPYEDPQAYVVHVEGPQQVALPLPVVAQRVRFFNPKEGLAFGPHPYAVSGPARSSFIYRTNDGGLSWEKVKEVHWRGLFFFLNPKYGWALADNGTEQVLTLTRDGGSTWDMVRPEVVSGP